MKFRNKTKILIVDVSIYIDNLKPRIHHILSNFGVDKRFVAQAIDYCICASLSECFCLPVVYQRNDLFQTQVYDKVRTLSDKIIFQLIDRQGLTMFNGQEVKVVCTGQDIYIVTYHEY